MVDAGQKVLQLLIEVKTTQLYHFRNLRSISCNSKQVNSFSDKRPIIYTSAFKKKVTT